MNTWQRLVILGGLSLVLSGCVNPLVFNPAYVNQATGEVYPLTPGNRSNFILVRVNNATTTTIEFVVTAEQRVTSADDPDTTELVTKTYRLLTQPAAQANDLGVLIDCPVYRVGLGETLDAPTTEAGLYLGAETVGQGGFGVPPNMNPLNSDAPYFNFDCGDTIVLQAAQTSGVAGGVIVRSFVLDDESRPEEVRGLDTFLNVRTLLDEQALNDG